MITEIKIIDQNTDNTYYTIEQNITNTVGLNPITKMSKSNLILIEFDVCNRNETSIVLDNISIGNIYSIIYYIDKNPVLTINKKCVSIRINNSHMYDSISLMFQPNK